MEQLPKPPVPRGVDLRDFQFMPLDVGRLRRSKAWLICKRRPRLAFYMLNLWTAAWHDIPAGSLEDDDDVLADLAMCPPKEWSRIRREVLRGWVKCSDGRLYHGVVVEKVLDAWRSKLEHAYDKECGRLRKASVRAGKKDFAPPTFEEWFALQESAGRPSVSSGQTALSFGPSRDVPGTSHDCPPENALKGEGREGRGKGQGYASCTHVSPGQRGDETPPIGDESVLPDAEAFGRVKAAYPEFAGAQKDWLLAERECLRRIDEGASWPELESAAQRFAAFIAAGGRSGPQYVDLPSKFFGNGLWREEWRPPPSKAEQRLESNISAAAEAKRQLFGSGK